MLFRVLLSLALVFAGGEAQLHALSHAQEEAAVALGSHGGGESAPRLNHGAEQCLLIHALDAIGFSAPESHAATNFASLAVRRIILPPGSATAPPYRSRAPPLQA